MLPFSVGTDQAPLVSVDKLFMWKIGLALVGLGILGTYIYGQFAHESSHVNKENLALIKDENLGKAFQKILDKKPPERSVASVSAPQVVIVEPEVSQKDIETFNQESRNSLRESTIASSEVAEQFDKMSDEEKNNMIESLKVIITNDEQALEGLKEAGETEAAQAVTERLEANKRQLEFLLNR